MEKEEASKVEKAIYTEFKDLSFGPDSKLNYWQLTMALSILMHKDEPSLRMLRELKH